MLTLLGCDRGIQRTLDSSQVNPAQNFHLRHERFRARPTACRWPVRCRRRAGGSLCCGLRGDILHSHTRHPPTLSGELCAYPSGERKCSHGCRTRSRSLAVAPLRCPRNSDDNGDYPATRLHDPRWGRSQRYITYKRTTRRHCGQRVAHDAGRATRPYRMSRASGPAQPARKRVRSLGWDADARALDGAQSAPRVLCVFERMRIREGRYASAGPGGPSRGRDALRGLQKCHRDNLVDERHRRACGRSQSV